MRPQKVRLGEMLIQQKLLAPDQMEAALGNIVAIGGLMKQQSNDCTQIPVAGDIPVLGHFFSQRSKVYNKQEIVILLKPTVILGESGWQQGLDEVQERLPSYDPRAAR